MFEKRRILHKFTISEISGVDRPAQEGALMTIMKRAEATSFDQRVEEILKRDDCSHVQAMVKARQEFPTDFEKYQGDSVSAHPIHKAAPTNDAVRIFEDIVRTIQRDNPKITRTGAMSQARRQNPDQWAAYQAA